MKSLLFTIGGIAATLLLTVGLASASASSRSPSTGAKVAVASSQLGRILVDARGHTLYLFANDRNGKSACTGKCAAFWPPLLTSGKPLASAGAKTSLVGTTKRADGRLQVTYNHHPLYTFAKDVRKGQTNGEEIDAFGAEWYVVSTAGTRIEKSAVTSSTADPAAGNGGSGSDSSGYGY
jgi:predicted lipoprotein with Yx(FWY)xxD motif